MVSSKEKIRTEKKLARSRLSEKYINTASRRIFEHLVELSHYKNSTKIGCYVSTRYEVQTESIISSIHEGEKELFLPKIKPNSEMDFVQISRKTQFYRNKFGIKEPESNNISIESNLDLVVLPLVAFDVNKNRIGMGGGYYDRKFEKLNTNEKNIQNREPILIGLGFDCQKTEEIQTEKWDVKLTCIISESGILR
tara:strand:+ start:121 stop:705 length:585 start_codon:yes stop_codon:yes gene_type:complete